MKRLFVLLVAILFLTGFACPVLYAKGGHGGGHGGGHSGGHGGGHGSGHGGHSSGGHTGHAHGGYIPPASSTSKPSSSFHGGTYGGSAWWGTGSVSSRPAEQGQFLPAGREDRVQPEDLWMKQDPAWLMLHR